jgi:2-oxoglutarate ferredoxin oxidoreductase subunit alpha
LISIWPFPEELFQNLAETTDTFIVPEMNLGQIALEVERVTRRTVTGVYHAGGRMISPERIHKAILDASSITANG